jgi:hypothetical protein
MDQSVGQAALSQIRDPPDCSVRGAQTSASTVIQRPWKRIRVLSVHSAIGADKSSRLNGKKMTEIYDA